MERKIYAVHDRDLKKFLGNLGLLDKVEKGEIKCPACQCVITLENLGFVYQSEGEIRICCDKLDCFYRLMSGTKNKEEDMHEK